MTSDEKITAALQVEAQQMQLPDDLLERIVRQGESVSPKPRVRLQPLLEAAAVAVLLLCLVGVAGLRSLHRTTAPGGDAPGVSQNPEAPGPGRLILSGDAQDEMVRVAVVVDRIGDGDWKVASTFENRSGATVELLYECDNLMRLDGSLIKRDCQPNPSVMLDPGQTWREELTVPSPYQSRPSAGAVAYRIRSHGLGDPVRTLRVPLQEGLRNCCPEPNWSTADVVARLNQAGLTAQISARSSQAIFGAASVDTVAVDGKTVEVWAFGDTAGAQRALKIMADPQANTVSWPGVSRFFQMGNLVIQIDFADEAVGGKIYQALFGAGAPPVNGP